MSFTYISEFFFQLDKWHWKQNLMSNFKLETRKKTQIFWKKKLLTLAYLDFTSATKNQKKKPRTFKTIKVEGNQTQVSWVTDAYI